MAICRVQLTSVTVRYGGNYNYPPQQGYGPPQPQYGYNQGPQVCSIGQQVGAHSEKKFSADSSCRRCNTSRGLRSRPHQGDRVTAEDVSKAGESFLTLLLHECKLLTPLVLQSGGALLLLCCRRRMRLLHGLCARLLLIIGVSDSEST